MSVAHDSSVSLVEFKPGDTVMLHHSAATSKMDPKYLGPFSIKCRTKSGAYILVDVTGNELEDLLPDKTDMESQANPDGSDDVNSEFDDDDDDSSKSYEVSKVLDHHGPTNRREYKVRWKGYSPKYDLWIPVKNFDDLQPVNTYWKKLCLKRG
ncbi:Chromomethylase [Balamuthia mandrillaris]